MCLSVVLRGRLCAMLTHTVRRSTLRRTSRWVVWASLALFLVVAESARQRGNAFQISELPNPLPEDCDLLIAPGSGPAAAVLRPLNLSVLREPNVTLVTCVKNLASPLFSAWLHVVPAEHGYGRHLRSENPIPLGQGSTAIQWNDAPAGQHASFVEIRASASARVSPYWQAGEQSVRSMACLFTIVGEQQDRTRTEPGVKGYRSAEANQEGHGGPRSQHTDHDGDFSDEWPVLHHIERLKNQQRGDSEESGARTSDAGPQEWCNMSGWTSVSMHEVVVAFLQAEWHKEEHRQWRGDEKVERAVRHPDTNSANENVLRAMLMATPRKINMLRTLPIDTRWYRATMRTPCVLSRTHIMCQKSWGEEFRSMLSLPKGASAPEECAALNISTLAALTLQCLAHCPAEPASEADGSWDTWDSWDSWDRRADPTDMLPGFDAASPVLCGRHCYKMHSILHHLRSRPHSQPSQPSQPSQRLRRAPMIMMMEEVHRAEAQPPCVILEGNHRSGLGFKGSGLGCRV